MKIKEKYYHDKFFLFYIKAYKLLTIIVLLLFDLSED